MKKLVKNNGFSGMISDEFIALDKEPIFVNVDYEKIISNPKTFAFKKEKVSTGNKTVKRNQPSFPSAGKGIFSHISEYPRKDFFGNAIDYDVNILGAGFSSN